MADVAGNQLVQQVLAADARQPLDVLQLRQGASLDEIHSTYRRLARALHPDKNSSPLAPEAFQRCKDAKDQAVHALGCAPTAAGAGAGASKPGSQGSRWAAFTSEHPNPFSAVPKARAANGGAAAEPAAWGSRPQAPPAPAVRSAWGAAPAADASLANVGPNLRSADAAQPAQQPQQPSDSDSDIPESDSDRESPSPPPSPRAADVRTTWNPASNKRRASQLFAPQGGSLPASLPSSRSQLGSLPASAPLPADRLGSWPSSIMPPSPPQGASSDRHDHGSWLPARRRSDPRDEQAAADRSVQSSSMEQPQRGWLPPPWSRRLPMAAGGLFADGGLPGPSSPVMCSMPSGSQCSPYRSPDGAAARADADGSFSAVMLGDSDLDGEAAGFGSAPAAVLDDDAEPLAEFHWASQARSSFSQPLPPPHWRRSSITTGSAHGGNSLSSHERDSIRDAQAAPQRQPLQLVADRDWRQSSGGDSLPCNAAANSPQQPQVQRVSPTASKARWAAAPKPRAVPASLPSGGGFLIGGAAGGKPGGKTGNDSGGPRARSTAGANACSSGASDGSPIAAAPAHQRRKRVLVVESDSEDDVPDVAAAITGIGALKKSKPGAGTESKTGGRPSANPAAALRQRVLGGSANTQRVLPRAFQAVEAVLDERQAALKEQAAAVARQKAAKGKQRVMARLRGRKQGSGTSVKMRG